MRHAIPFFALLALGCAAPVKSFSDDLPASDAGKQPISQPDADMSEASDPEAGDIDTGPPPCVYPSGPYGKTQGSVVAPTTQWQGYAPGAASISTISASDLYDCDGRNGINALLFDEAAEWCGPCQQEAQATPQFMQTWGPQGVKVLDLIIQNVQQQPATTATALEWRNAFNLAPVAYVVADPAFSFAHSGQNGLPMNILVDPRTMQITKIVEGYGGMDPAVSMLALKNKK